MKKRTLAQAITVALLSGGLAACGGSSDTAANGSITTVGTVTGFGSVYVNGVKYETDSSSYRVDDDDAFDDSALAIGMKVKVKGTVNADGVTGTATSIEYDDDLEGPIDANSLAPDLLDPTIQTFTIFGIPVKVIDGKTIFDDGLSFATLDQNMPVEVSGYFDGTHLVATYIEPQTDLDDQFEVKGTVSNLVAGDMFKLTAYGTTITVDISNAVTTPAGLADGVFVEVKGTWNAAASTFMAIEIEIDDEDYLDEDDDDVELKGVLTHDGTGYVVNGVPLLVLDDEVEDTDLALADLIGMRVEVEGFMQDGVLVVQEIGYEDGDIEIEGGFGAVTGTLKEGSVTIDFGNAGTVTVTSTNGTMIHDDGVAIDLPDLTTCKKLEADAYRNDQGMLIATVIECDDTLDEYSVEAPVEAWNGSSITLAELTYTVDGVITTITPPGATITVGTEVELTDLTGDGVADTIEVDD